MLPEKEQIIREIQEGIQKLNGLRKRLKKSPELLPTFKQILDQLQRNYYLLELIESSHDLQTEMEVKALVEEEKSEHPIVDERPEPESLEDERPEPEPEIHGVIEETVAEMPEELEQEAKDLNVIASTPIADQEFEDNSLANKLENQGITDLKKAIGLNERFYYANELFRGDGAEYSQAIEEFNHLGSMDDARRLITAKYEEKYKWDYDSEAVTSFLNLLGRRYQNS